ncbi:MAG TPA: DUF4296 domain-containing protein [Flavobacteriales bacterium]|nr:DUF4296 domain-containing protein [Flavobacteriales bacterium]
MNFFYFLSFLILFSCQDQKEGENIIPKEQFTNILEEIHLKESESQLNRINNTDYQEILSEYNVSKTDFENTLQYYSERPDLLEKIYEDIELNLEEKRNQLN